MKQYVFLLFAASVLMLTACKDKKTGNADIITTDYEIPKPSDTPIAMGVQADNAKVEWVEGRSYTVDVTRMPVDSLPMVTDEIGQKYVDNIIKVKVSRADSTVVFHRTFTKKSFLNWIDSDYQRNAVLAGIRFLKVENGLLVFTAWLNFPDAGDDEAVELSLQIDRNGEVTIQHYNENDRDDLEMMDTEGA